MENDEEILQGQRFLESALLLLNDASVKGMATYVFQTQDGTQCQYTEPVLPYEIERIKTSLECKYGSPTVQPPEEMDEQITLDTLLDEKDNTTKEEVLEDAKQ